MKNRQITSKATVLFKKIFLFVLLFTVIVACSKRPETEVLINKDKEKLKELLSDNKVIIYKSLKIYLKINNPYGGYAHQEPNEIENQLIIFGDIFNDVESLSNAVNDDGSLTYNPIKLYKAFDAYKDMKSSIYDLDEDMYPTLTELILPTLDTTGLINSSLIQPYEHFILSQLALGIKQLGKPISIYEISCIDLNDIKAPEIKVYLSLMKSITFMLNGLHYLSEESLTTGIDELYRYEHIDFYLTNIFVPKINSDEESRLFLKGLHHFFRGINRKMMPYEEDINRGTEDFKSLVEILDELELNNHYADLMSLYVFSDMQEFDMASNVYAKMTNDTIYSKDELDVLQEFTYENNDGFLGIGAKVRLAKFMFILINCGIKDLEKVDWEEFKKEYQMEFSLSLIKEAQELFNLTDEILSIQEELNPENMVNKLNLDSLNIEDKILEEKNNLMNKSEDLINDLF